MYVLIELADEDIEMMSETLQAFFECFTQLKLERNGVSDGAEKLFRYKRHYVTSEFAISDILFK